MVLVAPHRPPPLFCPSIPIPFNSSFSIISPQHYNHYFHLVLLSYFCSFHCFFFFKFIHFFEGRIKACHCMCVVRRHLAGDLFFSMGALVIKFRSSGLAKSSLTHEAISSFHLVFEQRISVTVLILFFSIYSFLRISYMSSIFPSFISLPFPSYFLYTP